MRKIQTKYKNLVQPNVYRKLLRKITVFILSCLLSMSVFAKAPTPSSALAKKQFIQEMVAKHHFSRAYLMHLFAHVKVNHQIISSTSAPFEAQPWSYYRNYFVTPKRVKLGAAYLKTHHALLEKMQKKYGIPASIIVAIIGVETEYGTHLGKYSVLQSLYTLGFYYPPREKFFRKELGQYLILARENHLPVTKLKGSYAGALGIPQFMPSSYRHYGVSAKGYGRVNLFENDDAIASVANYFYKMGWTPNQPIAKRLYFSFSYVNKKKAKRLVLPLKHGKEYWETFHNFNVIMAYNHNLVYAMAVYQLSQAIEKQYARNA